MKNFEENDELIASYPNLDTKLQEEDPEVFLECSIIAYFQQFAENQAKVAEAFATERGSIFKLKKIEDSDEIEEYLSKICERATAFGTKYKRPLNFKWEIDIETVFPCPKEYKTNKNLEVIYKAYILKFKTDYASKNMKVIDYKSTDKGGLFTITFFKDADDYNNYVDDIEKQFKELIKKYGEL